jgi:hypothetical protein
MARWTEETRGGEYGRWGDDRNAGRGGYERYGRERGEDWRTGSRGSEDWRDESSTRGRDVREDWRDRDDWRGREGRWEELRSGERRTYPSGRREMIGRGEEMGRGEYRSWEADRGEREHGDVGRGFGGWRGESDEYQGMGRGGRDYGGVMGGSYGGMGSAYGMGGMGGAYGSYGAGGSSGAGSYGAGRGGDWRRDEGWRGDEGWRESRGRDEGGGMMDRLKEGVRKLTGRGPKGYKRSDDRIRDDVSERIARSWIDSENVEVRVEGGEVTLTGTVVRREDKRQLEDIAEDVFGVEEVHNHLRVSRGLEGQRASEHAGESATARTGAQGTAQPGQRAQPGVTTQPGNRPH